MSKRRNFWTGPLFLLFLIFWCLTSEAQEKQTVNIAISRTEDPLFYINIFAPTIDHLRRSFPHLDIRTVEVENDVSSENLKKTSSDFLISPAGFFAFFDPTTKGLRELAARHAPLAANPSESVGSAVIVKSSRTDIKELNDLQGKRIVIRDPSSVAGWLAAKAELLGALGSKMDKENIVVTNYQYPDVYSYLDSGEATAAVLPACELEEAEDKGLVKKGEFKVLGKKPTSLSCAVSTPLYPDYVFSSFPHVSSELAKAISISLLTMPHMPDGASWSIAGDFRSILGLFKRLEIGPYTPIPFSLKAFLAKYMKEVILAVLLVLGLVFHIYRSNSLVFSRTAELREALAQRDRVFEIARSSLKRLNRLEKKGLISQLSSMFAHELKQPLSAAANYANGLKLYSSSKEIDPVILQGIEAIASETTRASEIVERVRSYAKSSVSPLTAEADLAEAVRKALASFYAYVPNACSVVSDLPEHCIIQGDVLELEILVLNLLKNAAEAVETLKEKGKIQVSLHVEKADVVLTVKDNGPRISDEVIENMRQALQASLKSDGLGLGLMIVMAIAERHRAVFDIKRGSSEGLVMQFIFPKDTK